MISKPSFEPAVGAPPFEVLQVIDDPTPRSGPENMALDEVLLETSSGGPPLLRFYRWSAPTVSFGFFEPAEDARRLANGREIVRRMTGGGLVEHGEDLTYTLVVPRPDPFVNKRSAETYRTIHAALAVALAHAGVRVDTHLEPAEKVCPIDGNACFQRPVPHDLLADGAKAAGGAQRRTRHGLLHQGSVRFAGRVGEEWMGPTRLALPTALASHREERVTTARELIRGTEVAAAKYATVAWTERR